MIVVDGSVVAAFILREPGWENLAELLTDCLAVDLAAKEAMNAVLTAFRREMISMEDVATKVEALEALLEVNIKLEGQRDLIDDALRIAVEGDATIYDALPIALARKLKLSLATKDKPQHEAAMGSGVPSILL